MPIKPGLGYWPDAPDPRDYEFELPPVSKAWQPPREWTWRGTMPPVRDQGLSPTCVAWAVGNGMKGWQEKEESGRLIIFSDKSIDYFYKKCKEIDGLPPNAEGTTLRAAMQALLKDGIPPEDWLGQKEGKFYRIRKYERLLPTDPQNIKTSLVINGPLVAGFPVYKSWYEEKSQRTGEISVPSKSQKETGKHAVCIVGYNDGKERWIFRNSWGKRWGDDGYGHLPYEYLEKYAVDIWVAYDILEI